MLIYVFIILYGREKCKVVNCNLAEHGGGASAEYA